MMDGKLFQEIHASVNLLIHNIITDGEYYAELGFAALCRATLEVTQKAKKENRQLPIWKDGKVTYGCSSITPEQVEAVNSQKPTLRS